ncbi:Serine/threonine-protein kinase PrkC [Enhygromyxa salina]|uniref:Serine/threonine-protein kinase PrkC n=1 Tax=Enhygromyxa salina TaxID=215803 RepID=A0A2S9YE02_9BACT|nr:serine/threonine-protein kinase [Enhygromyxa salina]PRQ03348.1 Serine/threonine-protein kinase PrkC [Enhygromyxa salina]
MSGSQDAPETEKKAMTTRRRQSPLDYFEELRADIEFVDTLETVYAYKYPGASPPEPEWPEIGHFEVREWVGHGGYGAVVIGRDTKLDRFVALKLCPATLDPEAERKFRREVQLLAAVSHPNIVTVHEIGCHGDDLFCAMEYIRGVDGASYLGTDASDAEIVETYCRAGEGLAAAHAQDIVHGDFKPSNVLIGTDGRVCVADFGLARRIDESDEAAEPGSSSYRGGTLPYVAPELLRGGPPSPASDQWAFCVSLWLSLFTRYPFEGEDETSMLVATSLGPKPATVPPGLCADVREILCRGLSIDPAARYPSVRALVDELRRLSTNAASPPEPEAEAGTGPGSESERTESAPKAAREVETESTAEVGISKERVEVGLMSQQLVERARFLRVGAVSLGSAAMGAALVLAAVAPRPEWKLDALAEAESVKVDKRQLGTQKLDEANLILDKEVVTEADVERVYELWLESQPLMVPTAQTFLASESLDLARRVDGVMPGRKRTALMASYSATKFRDTNNWTRAAEAACEAAKLAYAAGDQKMAAEQERNAAMYDPERRCELP